MHKEVKDMNSQLKFTPKEQYIRLMDKYMPLQTMKKEKFHLKAHLDLQFTTEKNTK